MFEFDDELFPFESFPLPVDEGECLYFESPNLGLYTYLGDEVWVIDTGRQSQQAEQANVGVPE